MISMKHYYRIADLIIQVLILVLWLTTLIGDVDMLGLFYLITGGWFLVSLIIHYITCNGKYENIYKAFSVAITVIFAVFCFGLIWPFILISELYTLFFVAPLLALAYTVACFMEIYKQQGNSTDKTGKEDMLEIQ